MEHFYQSIDGWSDGIPELYQQIVDQASSGMHFVEIGSWRGRSSAYMAVAIANSLKRIKFDCVDTWRGSPDESNHQTDPDVIADRLYDCFKENMQPVKNYYNPIRATSVQASQYYFDNTLDFVYIDAQHDYASVCEDIRAWLPKVKSGGILAGHDLPFEPVRRAVTDSLGEYLDVSGNWVYRK